MINKYSAAIKIAITLERFKIEYAPKNVNNIEHIK